MFVSREQKQSGPRQKVELTSLHSCLDSPWFFTQSGFPNMLLGSCSPALGPHAPLGSQSNLLFPGLSLSLLSSLGMSWSWVLFSFPIRRSHARPPPSPLPSQEPHSPALLSNFPSLPPRAARMNRPQTAASHQNLKFCYSVVDVIIVNVLNHVRIILHVYRWTRTLNKIINDTERRTWRWNKDTTIMLMVTDH